MAANGRTLACKRRVAYRELVARSLINRCSSPRVPFRWTINSYRGCEFGCLYCYARYTHEFLELRAPEDFERRIFAKAFQPVLFRAELARIPRSDAIGIGTATDPYQPAERRFELTRRLLEVLCCEQGRLLSLTTKSDLVVRDATLWAEIARRNAVRLNLTITTLDEQLARELEPFAPSPRLRLEALTRLRNAGIPVGVFVAPILPGLTDGEEQLEALARAASRAGALWLAGQPLFLKECSARVFFPFLGRRHPELTRLYQRLYRAGAYPGWQYQREIDGRFGRCRAKTGLAGTEPLTLPSNCRHEGKQLELFAPPSLRPHERCACRAADVRSSGCEQGWGFSGSTDGKPSAYPR